MKKLVFAVVLAAGVVAGFAVGRKCAGDACEASAPNAAVAPSDGALDEAKRRIAALEAELAEARKDAERVRKLAVRAEKAVDEAPDYDVIVAGGGPAGIGAGYMAAKRGARTLVLEKSGRLGGMAVNALVSPFSVFTSSPFVNDLAKRIGFGGSVDFHMADVRAFDVLTEAGADVMLHADVLGPVMDGERVTGLRVN